MYLVSGYRLCSDSFSCTPSLRAVLALVYVLCVGLYYLLYIVQHLQQTHLSVLVIGSRQFFYCSEAGYLYCDTFGSAWWINFPVDDVID